MTETYRNFIIGDAMVPDDKNCGFTWTHENYDGAPDAADARFGYAFSVETAKIEIDNWYIGNHFPSALDDFIATFVSYPGISDDELLAALSAKAEAIRANIRRIA